MWEGLPDWGASHKAHFDVFNDDFVVVSEAHIIDLLAVDPGVFAFVADVHEAETTLVPEDHGELAGSKPTCEIDVGILKFAKYKAGFFEEEVLLFAVSLDHKVATNSRRFFSLKLREGLLIHLHGHAAEIVVLVFIVGFFVFAEVDGVPGKDQRELPDGDFITVVESVSGDPPSIDEGSVVALKVTEQVEAIFVDDLGVVTTDTEVVDRDIAIFIATDSNERFVELVPLKGATTKGEGQFHGHCANRRNHIKRLEIL